AYSERFVLPLSHDEVVHGKRSLLGRMPGDRWQQLANLRALYAYMWAHPGKKLLFMGQEFGQTREWNFETGLEWHLLQYPLHQGLQALVRDLNRVYRDVPALHARDCEGEGFQWIVADDAEQSVYAWLRRGAPGDAMVAIVCNFTPVPRHGYRIGLPQAGRWREILNSDAQIYGGSGMGNLGGVDAHAHPSHGFAAAAEVTIPPLGAVYFQFEA
ncbi:MAG: alpha amylase C-terminal domain-containing protein, partial [Rudaea sp.]